MSDDCLLSMRNVAKTYGSRLLFKNVNINIKEGEGVLLTGPNGGGKSTLLRLAAGLSQPSHGAVQRTSDFEIAFLGHATFLYPGLTALENLSFWRKANFREAKNNMLEEILDLVGLLPFAHEQVRNFSKGMAQRLNFGRVFLGKTKLFLLDEPFSGIDIPSRQIILDELSRRKNNGAAVFLISHDPDGDGVLADTTYLLANRRLTQDMKTPRQC